MLKETEDESESSDGGTDELVNVLDSAADLRVQPADKQASLRGVGEPISGGEAQERPVHEIMPTPCMPSPTRPRLATPQAATPPSRKKKRSMAWVCCKASPTKPDHEDVAGGVPNEMEQAGPRLERLSNGDTFKGQYAEGVRQGHAVYRFANGDLYEGQFAHDRMQGSGVYTFEREGRFAGQVFAPSCLVMTHISPFLCLTSIPLLPQAPTSLPCRLQDCIYDQEASTMLTSHFEHVWETGSGNVDAHVCCRGNAGGREEMTTTASSRECRGGREDGGGGERGSVLG